MENIILTISIADIFIHDDGSRPGFKIDNLSTNELINIYSWLTKHSRKLPLDYTYWNNKKNRDIAISQEPNAALLVVTGEADSFSHPLIELTNNSETIENLNIFVYSDSLELFYRQGKHWSDEQINALLNILRTILSLSPEAKISACEEDGTPLDEKYQILLDKLIGTRDAK